MKGGGGVVIKGDTRSLDYGSYESPLSKYVEYGVMLGLLGFYEDNGQEKGNYYNGLYRV